MRRRKPAPHGFAVNGNLNKIKRVILMCRICSPPPGNLGNHAGRLAVYKPFTGSPKVLLITTHVVVKLFCNSCGLKISFYVIRA